MIPLNADLIVATAEGPEMATKEADTNTPAEQAPEPITVESRLTESKTPGNSVSGNVEPNSKDKQYCQSLYFTFARSRCLAENKKK